MRSGSAPAGRDIIELCLNCQQNYAGNICFPKCWPGENMADIKDYYSTFTDAWRFFRKYAGKIPMSGEAWAAEIEEKAAFIDQHAGCKRLARKLMTAVEDELEQLTV